MNIVVTGVAGFIGINLAKKLLQNGCRVFGLDNLSRSALLKLETLNVHPNFSFIKRDVRDEESLLKTLREIHKQYPIDEVWHLAANSDIEAGINDPKIDLQNTFMTTFSLLAVMKTLSLEKLIFASSSAIYGSHQTALNESSGPLFPISNYGAMKLASEGLITAACEAYLKHAYIFRFPNVVGMPATHGVIYDFITKLKHNAKVLPVLGNGEQQKPYLHVDELIDAMLYITEHSKEKINCYNIGPNDAGVTVRQIAETVTAHFAPNATAVYETKRQGWMGDVPFVRYDTMKLTQLGWKPSLSSLAAIQKAVKQIVSENQQP